jgi:hypothetical protein
MERIIGRHGISLMAYSKRSLIVKLVMPGLVPGIHVLPSRRGKDMDGRDI